MNWSRPFRFVTCLLLPPALAVGLLAQEPATEELKRKAAEVERLKADLERAQKELQKLGEENQKLRSEKARLIASPPPPPAPKPSRPLADVAPIKADDLMEVRDLVLYYQADAALADARFKKQTFRVKGRIENFGLKMFTRNYDLLLETPDKQLRAACNFIYADHYHAVLTRGHGQILMAISGKGEAQLTRLGEEVVIRGRCEGLVDGRVQLGRCELLK